MGRAIGCLVSVGPLGNGGWLLASPCFALTAAVHRSMAGCMVCKRSETRCSTVAQNHESTGRSHQCVHEVQLKGRCTGGKKVRNPNSTSNGFGKPRTSLQFKIPPFFSLHAFPLGAPHAHMETLHARPKTCLQPCCLLWVRIIRKSRQLYSQVCRRITLGDV